MTATIRKWDADAGTYGEVRLTLYAPAEPQGEFTLWDVARQVAELMREPVAVFFSDDPAKPAWTVANWTPNREVAA